MSARLQEMELGGERIAVGVQPLADEIRFAAFSEAKRHVAIALMRGATYASIATERGTAERTIGNQVQAVYRKLGVGSRLELSASVAAKQTTAMFAARGRVGMGGRKGLSHSRNL